MPTSVFAKYETKAWPYQYAATIQVAHLVGGTPKDRAAVEGWIRKNLGFDNADLIREAVLETMAASGTDETSAAIEVAKSTKLNCFKRDDQGLYIEGRHVKACIKEAASVAVAAGKLPQKKWGVTDKWCKAFVAEHINVAEDIIHTGRAEPDGVQMRFVNGRNGNGIQNEEYLEKVDLDFTIKTDHKFTDEHWAMIWLTAEQIGVGSTRSQGYGRFTLTRWEKIS